MIFQEPSDQERELRASALGLIERTMSLPRVRELAEAGGSLDVEHRRAAAQLGWFSVLGGDDPRFAERLRAAATIAEVRGAHLQPGTFIPANLLVSMCSQRPGPSGEVRAIADAVTSGESSVTWVCSDGHGHWGSDMTATTVDGGHELHGTSALVQDAHLVDWLMVRAVDGDSIGTFVVATDAPGVSITRLDGLDLTRSWARICLDGVRAEPWSLLERHGDGGVSDRHLLIAVALAVCETVGAMDRLFTSTVQYAKDRVAFGRPIGSFQAMKHLLADASVALETSKAMAEAAVIAVGAAADDAHQIVAMAKSFIGDASLDVVNACWQTHGGVAYTWKHDFHLYLRRITADAGLYGDPTWHREQLCRANGL